MKVFSRRLPALLVMLAFGSGAAHARPVIIENVSTIKNPNPALWTEFPLSVAVDGDSAMVTAQRWTYPTPDLGQVHQTAFLYQRSGSGWSLVRQLAETVVDGGTQNSLSVAMKGGLAAVHTTPMTIYERGASGWTLASSDVSPGDNSGFDLEIDGNRIVNGEGMCSWNASVVEKSADGVWRRADVISGNYRGCVSYNRGGSVDLAGDWAVVHQRDGMEVPYEHEQAWIFRWLDKQGWVRQGIAEVPWEYRFYAHSQVAIRGSEVFVSTGHQNGIKVFRDVPGQGFGMADRIRPLDNYMGGGETFQLDQTTDYLLQKANVPDRGAESLAINVYQRGGDGRYAHTAVLAARGNKWAWFPYEQSSSNVAVSGRTVLATDHNEKVVYHFELPAQIASPQPRQDTFSVGSAPDWLPEGGAFTVLRGDRSRVLRQSSAAGDARTIYQPASWGNQAIEVDVKPTQFAHAGAAISLITRWQGPHNYYEFVWGPERFEIRRMASGTLRTLVSHPGAGASSPHPGRNYRVRFESIGTLHRVYIDGYLYQSITSSGPSHGRIGVGTYRASADFDNVLVTPTPVYSMYRNRFYTDDDVPWCHSGEGNWHFENDGDVRLVQDSVAGEGRLTIGVPTTEQSVETTARLVKFAAPTGTQRHWFGVVARYVDENNHYVLALRNSHSLVLSRRVNGQLTTLGSHAANVVPGRDYVVRLDAFGDQLRAYLDGRLLFERTDASHPQGNSGMTTFKAHAEFEGFVAYQP